MKAAGCKKAYQCPGCKLQSCSIEISHVPDSVPHRKLLPFSKALQEEEECEGCAIVEEGFRIDKSPQSLGQTGLHNMKAQSPDHTLCQKMLL